MQYSKLYVGNLPYSVTSAKLAELFGAHGEVKEITVIEGKGFGFVEMSSPAEAEKAKEALNGQEYEGRALKIDEARPRTSQFGDNRGGPRGDRPGGGGGRPGGGGGRGGFRR
ncbi:MAG: RNA-binding protein [Proteobacteria bacterium]|nr:RNA-binding protein [Pseudomonadota bacterium]